ncbi:MAG: beta-galactosidase [Chloroflexota bacterium]
MNSPRPRSLAWLLKSKVAGRVIDLVLVPALLFYSLWLPPASMGARFFPSDYQTVTPKTGGTVLGPEGAEIQIPAGALDKRARVRLDALTSGGLNQVYTAASGSLAAALAGSKATLKPDSPEYLALQRFPQGLVAYGPFYRLSVRSTQPKRVSLSVPVPYQLAAVETGDLYGWDGRDWAWLPARVSGDQLNLLAELDEPVPQLFVVAQVQRDAPRLGTVMTPAEVGRFPREYDTDSLTLKAAAIGEAGGIQIEPNAIGSLGLGGDGAVLLSLSNQLDGVVRSDLADNLLISPELRLAQIQTLLSATQSGPYSGVVLDYRGVDPALRSEFTAFVSELAAALHTARKTLVVRVDAPRATGAGWDTGAYDWRALGVAADGLRIPALPEPAAYAPDGPMDRLLAWAVGAVDRNKLELQISAASQIKTGDSLVPVSYGDALGLLAGPVSSDRPDGLVLPGQPVNLSLPDLRNLALEFDPDAQMYWFQRSVGGTQRTVWLENAASIARKLQYVGRYLLGGVALEDAATEGADGEIASVINAFQTNHAAAPATEMAFVWTVADARGQTIDRQVMPLTSPDWAWTAPNNPGSYVIRAAISDDGGQTSLGAAAQMAIVVPTPTFTPTPLPTNTPTPAPTSTATPTPKPTATRAPQVASVQSAPAPRVGGYFGYGIQPDMMSDGDHGRIMNHIQAMGFNWVKQQVEWFRYNPAPGQYDWGGLDRLVASSNAAGVNVLLSVVKAPKWARPPGDTDEGPPSDPNTYGTFMRELAARYKGRVKAYEIWNEQNLYYEWGGHGRKLNAARYVELLKVAYNAVKSVDPAAVVISGALTPTGVNDGDTAIDDRVYLEQMYQNGLARYCDAVGAHPSGYNNPPDVDWRNFSDPSAPSFKGHPSFFFRGTMESYRNIMVKYGDGAKRIWATEFGWATVEGLGVGPAPGYGYAADNTEAEQAQFIVRAYQMGKAWGWVGPMFLWNLNFAPVAGRSDEKAAFGIVRHNWSPRPAYSALANMPK